MTLAVESDKHGWHRLRRLGVWIVFVFVLISTTFSVTRMLLWLTTRTDTTIPEASIVYAILSLLESPTMLYRDYTLPPYTTTPYMPLFYVVSALVTDLFGESVHNTYLAGRVVSFTSFSACVLLVYLISRRLGVDRLSATLGALLAAGTPIVFPWAVSCRPDFLALAFALLGLFLVSSNAPLRRSNVYAAGVAWSLAFFTKQIFVAAPLAFILLSTATRGLRSIIAPLSIFTLCNSLLLVALNSYFNEFFLRNIVAANVASPSLEDIPALIFHCLVPEFFVVLLLALAGSVQLARGVLSKEVTDTQRASRSRGYLVLLTAFVSTGLFSMAVLKPGAAENYFYEPLFLCSILSTLAFHRLRNSQSASLPLFLLAMFTTLWASFRWLDRGIDSHLRQSLSRPAAGYLEYLVLSTPGDILFISNGFGLRSGRGTTLFDGFNASYLEAQNALDLSPIRHAIESRAYSALLIQRSRSYYGYRVTPASLERAMDQHYYEPHDPCESPSSPGCSPFRWLVPRTEKMRSEPN